MTATTPTNTNARSSAAAIAATQRGSGRYFLRRLLHYRPGFFSVIVIILLYLLAFAGPLIYRTSPNEIDLLNLLGHPSAQHLLGTDDNGRDILARLLYGGRVSLIVGLIAVVIADTVGVLFGAFAGYFGKLTDTILMRITDALLAIPSFFLLLVVLSLFGPSLTKLEIAIGLTSWMTIARLVRGEFLRYKDAEFVQAAKAMGASDLRVIFRHIMPQAVSSVIVASSVLIGGVIIAESALVPRARRAAATGKLGQHAHRRAELRLHRTGARHLPRCADRHHCRGIQLLRRGLTDRLQCVGVSARVPISGGSRLSSLPQLRGRLESLLPPRNCSPPAFTHFTFNDLDLNYQEESR